MTEEIIRWIHTLPGSILGWLDDMNASRWGFYKDCRDAEMDYALPASHVAMRFEKLLRNVDDISALPGYSAGQAKSNLEFIQSCQQPDTGFFIDPNLDSRFADKTNPAALEAFRRAVTKYTIDMLWEHYRATPLYPYAESGGHGVPDADEFVTFMRTADWDNPWGAGSHAGGKAREIFNLVNEGREEYISALKQGIEIILSHQNPDTGMWGRSELPLYQQISGALKIIGRFKFFMGIDLPYMDKLADSCIRHHADGGFYPEGNDEDMCFPRNVAEMCIACLEQSDYRREELLKTLASIAEYLRDYQQPDGAFASQRSGRRFLHWNGAVICGNSDTPRSNINGTQGAIWALGMIGNYLGWPEMPFPDPQGDWRERIAKLNYAITISKNGIVEISKK
ncbi:MAG: hypothetical protein JXA11_09145 [Phycisphaerae bacterium]|nr:hypothetical protein [Phycisphaerae bacterium]